MKSDKSIIAQGLKNMENPPEKKSKDHGCCDVVPGKEDNYPWGLRLDLNDDSMQKLKLSADDFSVDDEVLCIIKCKVKRITSRDDEYTDGKQEEIELQITDMKIETEDE